MLISPRRSPLHYGRGWGWVFKSLNQVMTKIYKSLFVSIRGKRHYLAKNERSGKTCGQCSLKDRCIGKCAEPPCAVIRRLYGDIPAFYYNYFFTDIDH